MKEDFKHTYDFILLKKLYIGLKMEGTYFPIVTHENSFRLKNI